MPPSICPRPNCNGTIIGGKCSRCGAFSYTHGQLKGSQPGNSNTPVTPKTYVPPRLMTAEQWRSLTRVTLKPRSPMLKTVDRALKRFEFDTGFSAFQEVEKAYNGWVSRKGGMNAALVSRRNHSKAVQYLCDQLAGKDVRIPGDIPAFMDAGMENARLGIIYVFGNCRLDRDIFGIVLEGGLSVTGAGLDFGDLTNPTKHIQTGYSASKKVYVQGKSLLEARETSSDPSQSGQKKTIIEALTAFVKKFLDGLKKAIKGIDLRDAIAFVVGKTKALIKVLTDTFLKAVAPFISGGIDIAKGVAKTVLAAADLIKSWWQGKGVEILSGHPATIVQALRGAMARSLFAGLYETLKGAASLGLDIAGAVGAGVATVASRITDMVLSMIEALSKMVVRLVETFCMWAFCKKAHENWEMRDDPRALHKDPNRFNHWYKSYAVPFPAIAALTLNSRLCGDKMRFLRLMKDDDTVVSQSQFDKGCVFVDGLKSYAADYLHDSGFDFKSSDPIVKNAIVAAKDRGKLTFGSAVGEVVKQVFVS